MITKQNAIKERPAIIVLEEFSSYTTNTEVFHRRRGLPKEFPKMLKVIDVKIEIIIFTFLDYL